MLIKREAPMECSHSDGGFSFDIFGISCENNKNRVIMVRKRRHLLI